MPLLLYGELTPWYQLVDPVEDHRDEVAAMQAALERGAVPPPQTLLELGSGAGNNAFHLKARFRCTLSDLSSEMLALSRARNPECEHVQGDMRSLRLGRTFDAVLVHDAVMYALTEEDLAAVARTAFAHTRPGGAAVFAPDAVRDTFAEGTDLLDGQESAADAAAGGGSVRRAMRGLAWAWDPDPADTTFVTDYAFMLRDRDGSVRTVHDRHVEGLFPRATWLRVLGAAGYEVELFDRPVDDRSADQIFLCRA